MKEQVLVISTYPPRGSLHGSKFSAVASYTKNTLLSCQKALREQGKEVEFIVLADLLNEEKDKSYHEDGFYIIRCWQRGSLVLLFSLLKQARRFKKAQKTLFGFEWGMFGKNTILLGFLPFFLLFLRFLGKRIYFVSHGVLLEFGQISEQLAIPQKGLRTTVFTWGMKFLYLSAVFLSEKVIVFEEILRERLLGLTKNKQKIVTIPHGVQEVEKPPSKDEARKKLSLPKEDFIIISFGFLIWYKGSDWLVETMADYFQYAQTQKIILLMAGGESRVHKTNPVYQAFVNKIYNLAKKHPQKIIVTGFIDEDKIKDYFAAADLAVLPYRVLVSASGPLSWIFSYQKAFLVSKKLAGYLQNQDFQEKLVRAGLTSDDLFFELKKEVLWKKINLLSKQPQLLNKLSDFASGMYQQRRWSVIGKKYAQALFGN